MTRLNDQDSPRRTLVRVDGGIKALIPRFLDNRRLDVDRLGCAINQMDLESIRLLGHRMKGDAGSYGFTVIAEIGAQIEAVADNNDFGELQRLKNELSNFLDEVEIVYV
jgi:HPt (histidine-containing phosphotransfer) domain-containing protein